MSKEYDIDPSATILCAISQVNLKKVKGLLITMILCESQSEACLDEVNLC